MVAVLNVAGLSMRPVVFRYDRGAPKSSAIVSAVHLPAACSAQRKRSPGCSRLWDDATVHRAADVRGAAMNVYAHRARTRIELNAMQVSQ